jgi:hypothetical protein
VEDGQQVCIECGYDLTHAYRKPPSWKLWAVLGVIAVLAVGVGAGFAVGALTGDDKKKDVAQGTTATTPTVETLPGTTTPTLPETTPTVPTVPTTPTTPTTPGTTTPTIPTLPGEEPPGTTPPSTETTPGGGTPGGGGGGGGGGIAKWPAGESAYTVVLISAKSRSQADTKAREAKDRGIPAGILRSNNYSSLNPGYWVVFAGQYDDAEAARAKASDYQGQGFSQAYPRLVEK